MFFCYNSGQQVISFDLHPDLIPPGHNLTLVIANGQLKVSVVPKSSNQQAFGVLECIKFWLFRFLQKMGSIFRLRNDFKGNLAPEKHILP